MTTLKSAAVALAAVLCAATMTGNAEAKGFGHIGGGHVGHFAHAGHIGGHGHWGHGHFVHHGFYGRGFGVYAPYYSAYYDDDDYGDCYRVYRNHHWRTVCD